MLYDTEYEEYNRTYLECVKAVKAWRRQNRATLQEAPLADLYGPALDKYEELTGYRAADPAHLLKHRLRNYGLPCTTCGKHLRTPRARKCYECGQPRER
jgi:hypothetical protein